MCTVLVLLLGIFSFEWNISLFTRSDGLCLTCLRMFLKSSQSPFEEIPGFLAFFLFIDPEIYLCHPKPNPNRSYFHWTFAAWIYYLLFRLLDLCVSSSGAEKGQYFICANICLLVFYSFFKCKKQLAQSWRKVIVQLKLKRSTVKPKTTKNYTIIYSNYNNKNLYIYIYP